MTELSLINGVPGAYVVIGNRGLQYGDGVFRTVLAWDGALRDAPAHLDKLAADCARLKLQMPDPQLLLDESKTLIGDRQRAVLKWQLTRCAGQRGYRPGGPASDRIVTLSDAPVMAARLWEQGAVVQFSEVRLAIQPLLAGVKHLNRLEQVLAAAAIDPESGADEHLMCDSLGRVIGGTRSNVFWVRNGELQTPKLTRCGIAGVMRARVMQVAAELEIPLREVDATSEDLWSVNEGFITNALIGLWPLRRVEGRDWRAPGAVTQAIALALAHPRLT